MSLTVYNSQFSEIRYLSTKERLYFSWKPGTQGMEEEDFKREMYAYLATFQNHKVTAVCADLRENYFVVNLALQNWLDKEINMSAMRQGLKHKVFVMPSELILRLSTEQVADLAKARGLNVRNATTLVEAHQWLDTMFVSAVC